MQGRFADNRRVPAARTTAIPLEGERRRSPWVEVREEFLGQIVVGQGTGALRRPFVLDLDRPDLAGLGVPPVPSLNHVPNPAVTDRSFPWVACLVPVSGGG